MNTVSFSLYGSDPKYYIGAEKNIEQIQRLLPEWTVSIYYHTEKTRPEYVTKLGDMGAKMIDITNTVIGNTPSHACPMFWRFFSFFEDGYSIVRDLDSRFSGREVSYINKWIDSERDIFIIRDHPWHSQFPGGLIGMKSMASIIKPKMEEFVDTHNAGGYGVDQDFLLHCFNETPKDKIYYCGFDQEDNYIPRDDKQFFIGMQVDEHDKPIVPGATQALDFLGELGL